MNEDAWIELLNDLSINDESISMSCGPRVQTFEDEEWFLSEKGEITDRFLEAMKGDVQMMPEIQSEHLFPRSNQFDSSIFKTKNQKDISCRKGAKPSEKLEKSTSFKKTSLKRAEFHQSGPSKKEVRSCKKEERSHNQKVFHLEEPKDNGRQSGESDFKRKSLQLRVKGQLECIKSLEQRLQLAEDLVSFRDKQLDELQAKMKSMSELYHRGRPDVPSSILDNTKLDEIVQHYKKQLEILEGKLFEEVRRRHLIEERSKSIREYAEKWKHRCSELEITNKALEERQLMFKGKLDRMVKSSTSATDLSREKSEKKKDPQLFSLIRRTHDAEEELAKKQETIEHLNREISILKEQLFIQRQDFESMRTNRSSVDDRSHDRSLITDAPELEAKERKRKNQTLEWKDFIRATEPPSAHLFRRRNDSYDLSPGNKLDGSISTKAAIDRDVPETEDFFSQDIEDLQEPVFPNMNSDAKTLSLVKEMVSKKIAAPSSPLRLRFESTRSISKETTPNNSNPVDMKINRLQRIYDKVSNKSS